MQKFFFYIKTSINLFYEFFFVTLKSIHLYVAVTIFWAVNKYCLVVALLSNLSCLHYLNFFELILIKFPFLINLLNAYVNIISSDVSARLLLDAELTSTLTSQLIPYLQGNLFFVLQMLFLVVISI